MAIYMPGNHAVRYDAMRQHHVSFSPAAARREGGKDGILNGVSSGTSGARQGCGSGGASSRYRAASGIVIGPRLQTDRYTETLCALQSSFVQIPIPSVPSLYNYSITII